jgi:hypothetical protein
LYLFLSARRGCQPKQEAELVKTATERAPMPGTAHTSHSSRRFTLQCIFTEPAIHRAYEINALPEVGRADEGCICCSCAKGLIVV